MRVRVTRVNRKRSSPMMIGRILAKHSNKKEVFIADMGTSVIILPDAMGWYGSPSTPMNLPMLA